MGTEDSFPPTYIVIQFSESVQLETAQWIVGKICERKKNGGAELILRAQPPIEGQSLTIHVSADNDKLLELAEELEIRVRDRRGVLREFALNEIDEFRVDKEDCDFLSLADKQVVVRHELENIRALSHEICVLGYPKYTLYEGQSILAVCLHYGIIKQMYPLHDDESVKKLGQSWFMTWGEQPFEDIRLYFGESVTLYFQFLGFYTLALLGPTILGFLQMVLYPQTLAFFCIVNVICATVFLELWRKKCSELAFIWGTIGMTSFDEPRPNFHGVMGIDQVTGKMLPQSPRWKTYFKMYCVSLPLVILCMFGAFLVMLFYFWIDEMVRKDCPSCPQFFEYVPSTVYAIVIYIMNLVYRKFATFLTEWENHRTQSQFDRHRVTKLVLFEFVNNFMSLFYIAFIIQDRELLRYQLASLLIILQFLNNIQEAVLPHIIQHYAERKLKSKKRVIMQNKGYDHPFVLSNVTQLHPEDSRIDQAILEGMKEPYDDPYDDYLELFIQFGYVFLFSSVYPMAAFWALMNNILEIRSDAFKLCCVYQRPMSRRVKDTGAWQRSFQALCALAVMTNCGLLCLSPDLRSVAPDLDPTKWILIFVLLEHLLLGLRQVLHYAIPDKPEWVRMALAKRNYQSKQALKIQD